MSAIYHDFTPVPSSLAEAVKSRLEASVVDRNIMDIRFDVAPVFSGYGDVAVFLMVKSNMPDLDNEGLGLVLKIPGPFNTERRVKSSRVSEHDYGQIEENT
jgi:hypothetical protein